MDLVTALIIGGVVIVVAVFFCIFATHTMHKCSSCGHTFFTKRIDASPAGPNPLGIVLTVIHPLCKKCGTFQQLYLECAGASITDKSKTPGSPI